MKTSSTFPFILAVIVALFHQTAQARIIASTVSYKGEVIAHFELPEVEIKGERISKAQSSVVAPTTTYEGEKIAIIELPEVVIRDYAIQKAEPKNITAKGGSAHTVDTPSYAAVPAAKENNEVAKKPLIHQVANKIYEAGFRLFNMVSEGLFFRS